MPNGVVDIIKPKFLIHQNSLHGNKVLGLITTNVPDIDSRNDLESTEKLLSTSKYKYLINYLKNTKNGKL